MDHSDWPKAKSNEIIICPEHVHILMKNEEGKIICEMICFPDEAYQLAQNIQKMADCLIGVT